MKKDEDIKSFKIVLIGDSSVGKTSIISRLLHDKIHLNENTTIGASFNSYNKDKIRLNIWDTAGQERYRSLVSMYYRDVVICLLVFDINKIDINNIKYWIENFKHNNNSGAKIFLIGNKYDNELIQINNNIHNELLNLINDYNLIFFKTSAKNNINIKELFNFIINDINQLKNNKLLINNDINNKKIYSIHPTYNDDYKDKNGYCCFGGGYKYNNNNVNKLFF